MRTIYWRELREFGVIAVALVVGGASAGVALWMEHHPWVAILATAAAGGAIVGLLHGLHDQVRRGDLFLRHRPIASWQIELGRTAAGATVCVAAVLAMINALMLPWRVRSFPGHGPLTAELTLVCFSLALAVWAALRYGASRPRPGIAIFATALVGPAIAAAITMLPSPTLGVLAALATTVAFATLSILDLSGLAGRRSPRLLCGALVALVGVVAGLESAAWIRAGALELTQEAMDMPGMTGDGSLVIMRRGGQRGIVGADGRVVTRGLDKVQWAPLYQLSRVDPRPAAFEREDALPILFGPGTRTDTDTDTGTDTGTGTDTETGPRNRGPESICRALAERWGSMAPWRYADGRFVMEDLNGATVGTIGPDGWVPGPVRDSVPDSAPRFVEPRHVRLTLTWDQTAGGSQLSTHALIVSDDGLGEVVVAPLPQAGFWSANAAPGTASAPAPAVRVRVGEPGRVRIETPQLTADRWRYVNRGNEPPLAVLAGDELVVISGEGELLGRVPFDRGGETIIGVLGGMRVNARDGPTGEPYPAVVASIVGALDPAAVHVRLRQFDMGAAPIMRETLLTADTLEKRAGVWLEGASVLTSPPLLSFAGASAPVPADLRERQSSWWLSPAIARRPDGARSPWLAVAALIGLLSAAGAWSRARHRTGPAGTVAATATALLLGPAGLAAACVAIPPTAVEPCACGRRRAVAIAACPSCGAAWPGPEPTGTEIIVEFDRAPAPQPVGAP